MRNYRKVVLTMSQSTYYAGVPVAVSVSITNAAGNPYSLSSVSCSYGFIGSGPPKIAAMTEGATGTNSVSVTPAHPGTFTVTVRGYDGSGNLEVVGQCQEIISPAAWQ